MADTTKRQGSARAKRKQLFAACLAATVLSFSGGCTIVSGVQRVLDYSDERNEFLLNYRNQAYAAKAWHQRKPKFCNRKYLDDFGAGFQAGYLEVANGGTGCTPAFAPREYWSWKYQTPEGQQRVAAWYAGFPLGAQAAEEDGVGNFSMLMPSSNIVAQYEQASCAPPAPVPPGVPMEPMGLGAPTPAAPIEAVAPLPPGAL